MSWDLELLRKAYKQDKCIRNKLINAPKTGIGLTGLGMITTLCSIMETAMGCCWGIGVKDNHRTKI